MKKIDVSAVRASALVIWDDVASAFEATWEVFILPALLILLAFWQTSGVALWGFRKVQGVAPYLLWAVRKGQEALPSILWGIGQAVGMAMIVAFLGGRVAVRVAACVGRTAHEGWQMRRELVNEWKEVE